MIVRKKVKVTRTENVRRVEFNDPKVAADAVLGYFVTSGDDYFRQFGIKTDEEAAAVCYAGAVEVIRHLNPNGRLSRALLEELGLPDFKVTETKEVA